MNCSLSAELQMESVALRSCSGMRVLSVLVLLSAGRCGASLRCLYCPPQARGGPCGDVSTECAPRERCFSGWRRYGRVHVLAAQGCAPPELCGSNRTLSLMGSEYEIRYECCCRDRCNTRENRPRAPSGVTVGPTELSTASPARCPEP